MNDETPSVKRAMELLEQHVLNLKEEGVRKIEMESAMFSKPSPAAAPVSKSVPVSKPTPAKPQPVVAVTPPLMETKIKTGPRPSREEAVAGLAAIAKRVSVCAKCKLCETRIKAVPGQGNPQPEIMFIGEGPGTEEDKQGFAFVGRAGQLLTRMIQAMGFTRDDVFIGNIVKCRPTIDYAGQKDRPPTPEEMAACILYLREQIALLQPKVIVALGATSVKGLFGDKLPGITKLRGTWLNYEGIDVMPTFHPSYLLRQGGDAGGGNQAYWDVWSDLTAALKKIGREPPPKK